MLIPFKELSSDITRALAVEYLTSGADQYMGNLERDVEKVITNLENGKLVIQYSEAEELARLVDKESLLQH